METKLINFWWRDLPVAASRVSGFLSVILADGIYLTHWSKVAAYAPVVSLVLGLLIGWFHFAPGETFTFSIGVMALLMTISSFGTGLGSHLLVGYAFGDFFSVSTPKNRQYISDFFCRSDSFATLLCSFIDSLNINTPNKSRVAFANSSSSQDFRNNWLSY